MHESLIKSLETSGFVLDRQFPKPNKWVFEYYVCGQYTIQVVIEKTNHPASSFHTYSGAVELYFDNENLDYRNMLKKFDNINDTITCAVAMKAKMRGDIEAEAYQE